MKKAIREVCRAWTIEGKCPSYHRQQKDNLEKSWKSLHTAITNLTKKYYNEKE